MDIEDDYDGIKRMDFELLVTVSFILIEKMKLATILVKSFKYSFLLSLTNLEYFQEYLRHT